MFNKSKYQDNIDIYILGEKKIFRLRTYDAPKLNKTKQSEIESEHKTQEYCYIKCVVLLFFL